MDLSMDAFANRIANLAKRFDACGFAPTNRMRISLVTKFDSRFGPDNVDPGSGEHAESFVMIDRRPKL